MAIKKKTVTDAAGVDAAPAVQADTAQPVVLPVATPGVADPAPAPALTNASGAIVEPAILDAVDVIHEAVDNNPRAGTSSEQNAVDWNDANRRAPGDPDFAGQGLDPTPYGYAAAKAG